MLKWIKTFAARRTYRYVSTFLTLALLALPITFALMDAPKWLGFVLALPFAIFLIIVSHFRMIDAAMSPGWVVLMILVMNFGPSVELPGITLYLSHLVHLVPVAIGWIAPARSETSADNLAEPTT
ncbi:hypothetical protein GRI69_13245 [Erythrobacter vulgaris]|uniref:Uncharacterized protein n=1 Tax=Qipengyuania vulgaris TaxID=291985 RepID=A0A844XV19_9SPHN|nr:hypothetical protein [Qipengyuania vulgaris]MXO49219.1 hypothetical protein [Qipengyuania vulgaris]